MIKTALLIFGILASVHASSVMAHSGHGVTAPASALHYLTELLHVLPVFASMAVIVAVAGLLRRRSRRG